MANTGNTQQQINYGAAVNDGSGDPLRTAFIKTDDNFDNIWLAGPVGSNITITNNTIQANNTNGNLILSPNGIGAIQTNSRLLPRLNNTYDLGSTTLKYRTGYFGAGGLVVDGNVAITGNLSAGNISYTSNVFVGDLQGSVYADDSTIMVDAVDNQLYASRATIFGNINISGNINSSANVVALGNVTAEHNLVAIGNVSGGNIISVANVIVGNQLFAVGSVFTPGNVQGAYILGNGSFLTGLPATYGNANVISLLSAFGANTIFTTGNIQGAIVAPGGNGQVMYNRSGVIGASPYDFNFDESTFTLYVKAGSFSGEADGTDALYVGAPGYTFLGSDIMAQITGNVDNYSQINFQNINSGSLASGDYILTADNGTDSTYYLDMGLASSNHADPDFFGDTSSKNDAYIYVVANDQAGPSTGGPGNLILGSTNGSIKMFVGNTAQANVVATVESDQLLMSGNIVPATSNVYSLGNSTNQWSDLYVSNATIYMNNVPISLTAGNVLTVDGNDVVTTTANGQTALGNLSVDDNNIYNTNGQGVVISNFSFIDEAETAYVQIPAGNSTSDLSIVQEQGNVRIAAGGANWTFDTTGNLTAPGNITANTVTATESADLGSLNFYASVISLNDDLRDNIFISPNGESYAYLSVPKDSVANVQDVRLHNDIGNVEIGTGGGTYNWLFDSAGDLTVPNYVQFAGNTFIGDEPGGGSPAFRIVAPLTYGATIETDSDISGNSWTWSFGADGVLGAPGNITATNFIGSVAADNVVGTVSSATTAGTVTSNEQANITSVGTLTSLSVSGNITAGNILTDGYFYANGDPFVSSNYSDSNVVTLLGSFGSNTVSTTGNVSAGNVNTATKVLVGNALSITNNRIDAVSQFVLATSNTATGNNSSILMDRNGEGVVVVLENTAGSGTWGLYQDNILFPDGSRQYSAYGNANVVANLAALGSNPISTTGNITAGNFIGNIQLVGNVQGTQANVSLVAGSYTYTFDNTGYFTLPTVGGDEGGEIHFGIPAANTTLQNSVKIDVYQDRIRFFEGSANAKGAFIDLSQMDSSVGTALGYLNIPQVVLNANATAALSDSSKHFYSTTAGNLQLTIPDNSNVAFPTGATLTVVVNAAGNVVVAQGTGVSLYMAGSSTTGNRVVGAYGLASVMKVAANTWVISGTGVY